MTQDVLCVIHGNQEKYKTTISLIRLKGVFFVCDIDKERFFAMITCPFVGQEFFDMKKVKPVVVPPQKKKLQPWLVIFLLAAIMCLLVAVRLHNATKMRGNAQALQPIESTQIQPDVKSFQKQAIEDWLVLKDLIQNHPHREIREDLYRLIDTQKVFVSFQDIGAKMQSVASVMYINTPTHGTALTLIIGRVEVLSSKITRRHKELVLYHEWIHLKQQLEQREPKWLALKRLLNASFTEEEISVFYKAEMEAYLAECKLAVSLNSQHELDFCDIYAKYGERALRENIAMRYGSMPHFSQHTSLFMKLAQQ